MLQTALSEIDQATGLVSDEELRLHEFLFAPVNGRPVSLETLVIRCEAVSSSITE